MGCQCCSWHQLTTASVGKGKKAVTVSPVLFLGCCCVCKALEMGPMLLLLCLKVQSSDGCAPGADS